MDLLKALAMPFQAASLLFVAMSALLLTLVTSVGSAIMPLALLAILLLLVWLTQFAFALIDDAANGVQETTAATAEMLSPFGDPRCWVHPALAAATSLTLYLRPEIPRLPVLATCALLLPVSIGAIAISGRALDALNPFALVRVLRGLGPYYPLAVLFLVLCVAAGVLLTQVGMWSVLRFAALELLVLLGYAFIGGAVYARRLDLGFEPRVSPERVEMRGEQERVAQRQQMIDGLYRDLRVREPARAIADAKRWIEAASPQQLPGDVQAILEAAASWTEPRGLQLLLRSLIPQLQALKQPALAFAAVEAGLAAAPRFSPELESDAIAAIRYASQTGRKRVAASLLTNFMHSSSFKSPPGPELQELCTQLQVEPPVTPP
jgi:uncharacterized membrane protein